MPSLTIDVSEQIANALPHTHRAILRELSKGVNRAGHEMANHQKQHDAPKAHSTLTNSIAVIKTSELSRMVGATVNYAENIVKGRAPGGLPPPLQAMLDYVRVKGISSHIYKTDESLARAMGLSIAKNGIAPNDYVSRTVNATQDRVRDIISQSVQRGIMQGGMA